MNYRPRLIDSVIKRRLNVAGAILIEGTKWCGKTTTGKQFANSILDLSDVDTRNYYKNFVADLNIKQALVGDNPRLIDEWQEIPTLWDTIRHEVDQQEGKGLFILTGSSVPHDTSEISHSGTGRFSWIKMRPMSLFESNDSNGSISLENLFNNPKTISATSSITLNDLVYLICRGGWPAVVNAEKEFALDFADLYYESLINSDLTRIFPLVKNIQLSQILLKSLARRQGSPLNYESITTDIGIENSLTSISTVRKYVDVLNKLFVLDNLHAWNPNLRSKTAIRTTDTIYFTDPSIATSALGIGSNDLMNDLRTLGFLFETMAIRDLKIFADTLNGTLYHYRDKNNLECDAVIHLKNGSYGLIEIKLGGPNSINEGIKNLKKLESKIDTEKMNKPSFLMVLTGVGEFAFKSNGGVFVVPIGCLRN